VLLSVALTIAVAANLPASKTVSSTEATETVIRLNVYSKAAPKPALRYLLLPELKEMTPGNPIEGYLQCLLDQDYTTQIETLTKSALRQADRAARMDKPDWQILLKTKTEGFELLLPDVQKIRGVSVALRDRFRSEIAEERFDDAIATAKTMFAMSRHLSEHPTLIGDLVGFAVAAQAVGPLEEMLQQSGCPNLYWAFANLPHPLVPLDRAMEGERLLFVGEFRDLDDKNPMTPAQLKKLKAHIDRLISIVGGSSDKKTQPWLDEHSKDPVLLEAARKRLVEYGIPEERLLKFPVDQILLLDEKRDFEFQRDEAMKLAGLPYWQAEEQLKKINMPKDNYLFDSFSVTRAIRTVRQAQMRVEQRLVLLRHVEALRLYAVDHKGLPEKLSDITVPLPADPFTGKEFRYELKGDTAHLRGTPPEGQEKNPGFNVRYEIVIKNRHPG
jgi:hypothetical protein